MPKKNTFNESKLRTFVGREEHIQKFWDTIQSHARQNKEKHHILTYYGVGGIGKSELERRLIEEVEKSNNCIAAQINFDNISVAQDFGYYINFLRESLRQRNHNIKFPRFEYAYFLYFSKINPITETKARSSAARYFNILTPAVQSFITETLLAGVVGSMSALLSSASEEVKNWWDDHRFSELEHLHNQEPRDILALLPSFFVSDLNEYLENNKEIQCVFFIDTFEKLLDKRRDEDQIYTHDQWLRDLIIDLPRVIWVICGKEELAWEKLYLEEEWGESIQQHELVELPEEESKKMLSYAKIPEVLQDRIVSASMGHPLYLNLSIDTYQEIAKEREPKVEDFADTKQEIYLKFINHLTQPEADMFKILSCLQKWDVNLLEQLAIKFNASYHNPSNINRVANFSFVRKNADEYVMHQLMREHLYNSFVTQAPNTAKRVHQFCFDYFIDRNKDIPNKENVLRIVYHGLSSYRATVVFDYVESSQTFFSIEVFPDFYIQLYKMILRKLLQQEDNTTSIPIAKCSRLLGLAFSKKGQHDFAIRLINRAASVYKKIYGEKHTDTIETLNYLASAYHNADLYLDAEHHYRKLLSLQQEVLGRDAIATTNTLSNLAYTLFCQGKNKYYEAEELYNEAVAICEKNGTDEALASVAMISDNPAALYSEIGRILDAELLQRKAVTFRRKMLGDHYLTYCSINNLAETLAVQKKNQEAKECYEEALEGYQKIFGEHHIKMEHITKNIALFYLDTFNYEKAEIFLHKLIVIYEKHSAKSEDLSGAYSRLADVKREQGKIDNHFATGLAYQALQNFLKWKKAAPKLKVCGMKYPDNLVQVAALNPDYLGFIFYEPSPRFMANTLSPTDLSAIPENIQKVGVFVNASTDYMLEMSEQYGLDLLQLHGQESLAQCQTLHQQGQRLIKVFSLGSADFDFTTLETYQPYVDFFLFDTQGKQPGGNGVAFDWQQLAQYRLKTPFFLSGGIGLDNLTDIATIASSQPYALDVNSRFETEPGRKRIDLLKQLVTHVR